MPVAISTPRVSTTPRRSSSVPRSRPLSARTPNKTHWDRSHIRTSRDVRKTGQPRPPVGFNTFEVGRSSMPTNATPTSVFRDTMKRGLVHPHMSGMAVVEMSDPGAYHPYAHDDIATRVSFSHNKMNRAFGTVSERTLSLNIYGAGVPGPESYDAGESAKRLYGLVDHNRSVFQSTTDQRPSYETSVPSPDTYTPDHTSVRPNVRDAMAQMRSTSGRFKVMAHPDHFGGDPSTTGERIGPGTYESHEYGSISQRSARRIERSSKLRYGFDTIGPQRALPFHPSSTPGPGAYQPEI